jgi:RHS repeat-associated protein
MKRLILSIILSCLFIAGYAITGTTYCVIGSSYTYSNSVSMTSPVWSCTGGSVISSNGYQSATVTWFLVGTGTVKLTNSSTGSYYTLSVTVINPPSAPVGAPATSVTSTGFTANWGSVTNSTSYKLDVSISSSFSSYVSGYSNLSVSGTSKAVTGLSNGTTYYYRVRALTAYGYTTSNSSTITVITIPAVPTATATTTTTSYGFTANWASVTGASHYLLDVSTNSSFTEYVSGYVYLQVSGTSKVITDLLPSTTYYYRVRAVNSSGGNSSYSNVIIASTIIGPPTTLSSTGIINDSFNVTWTDGGLANEYRLDVSTSSSFSSFVSGYENLLVSPTVGTISVSVANLSANTTYYFRVRSVNATGTSSNSTTKTITTATDAPIGLGVSAISSTGFSATWIMHTGAVSYQLDVSRSSTFSSYLPGYINLSVVSASQSITDLIEGTTYYFRVRALNSAGSVSPDSQVFMVITTPGIPIMNYPTDVGGTGFTANWNSVTGATFYYLDVSTSSAFTTYSTISTSLSTQWVTITSPDQTYYYRVRAGNSHSISGYSETKYVIIPANLYAYNYIRTAVFLKDGITSAQQTYLLGADEQAVTYEFFDGLGRPSQIDSRQASPTSKDIIQTIEYDAYGREETKYLPYTNEAGYYRSNAVSELATFYSNQTDFGQDASYYYSKTIFENSLLNRIEEQGSSGKDWQPHSTGIVNSGHTIKYEYGTNTQGEVHFLYIDGDIMKLGKIINSIFYDCYPARALYKKIIKDENWTDNQTYSVLHTTEEFKDKHDQIVLKKSYVEKSGGYDVLETYYVYDDFGLLRYVLSPEASSQLPSTLTSSISYSSKESSIIKPLCYYYEYDANNRMIVQQFPSVGPIYMVYDKRDRIIAKQDSIQRLSGNWLVTKYDYLNRPIMTAIKTISDDRNTLQEYLNDYPSTSSYSETRTVSGVGYTLNSSFSDKLSLTESDLLTVTYYDTYDYPGKKEFVDNSDVRVSDYYNTLTGEYYFKNTRSLVTGNRVKVIDGKERNSEGYTWLLTTYYYDDKYHCIQSLRDIFSTTKTDNEIVSTLYDFTGKVIKTLKRQVFMNNTNTVINANFYDNYGRKVKCTNKVNSGTTVTIASMEFNELGHLKSKTLNGDLGSGIQDLNYTYNIRGWLEKINDLSKNPSSTSYQKFNLGLYYNTVPTGLSVSPQYNGNITAMVWNTPLNTEAKSPADKQGYGFTYDGLNRLTFSIYGEGSTFTNEANANNESCTYDLNGNIRSLKRNLKGIGTIDDLTYTYKNGNVSNLLDRVDDLSLQTKGFSDGASQANEYLYDGNGNMTSDSNKGYTSIIYNYLNLPRQVGTGSQYISYIYNAIGEKVAKISTTGDYTYYNENFVYEGTSSTSSLSYIIHEEGIMTPGSGYSYFLKDHLGNTRMVVNTEGTGGIIEQQTDYYPFGMSIAEYNGSINKYRYNGKEFQEDVINNKEFGCYDFGSRLYDPQIGRWYMYDRLAENYISVAPYCYTLNNPIRYTDPDGCMPWDVLNKAKEYFGTWYEWGGKKPYYIGGAGVEPESASLIGQNVYFILYKAKFIACLNSIGLYISPFNNQQDVYNYYGLTVPMGKSMGIDCSGLARIAFNADPDKLMPNIGDGTYAQITAFSTASKNGTGVLHSDLNLVKEGDLIFKGIKNGVPQHVMVATGEIKVDKDGRVIAYEVVDSWKSGTQIATRMKKVEGGEKIGHTFRTTDKGLNLLWLSNVSVNPWMVGFYEWITNNNLWSKTTIR